MTDLPAVYSLLPREQYDALQGRNSSLLKLLASKTPAHAWNTFLSPKVEQKVTAALRRGILLHQCLLEPDLWAKCRICTSGPTTKAFAEMTAKAEREGAICAVEDEYEDVQRMAAAVLQHPALGALFAPTPENVALNELTLQWADPEGDEICKARLDAVRITDEGICCLDLKSTVDASPIEFGKSAANFFYHLQGAFYADGLYYCAKPLEKLLKLPEGTLEGRPVIFEYVAIEKESCLVARYRLTAEQAALGRELYRSGMQLVSEATRADRWVGYDERPLPLTMPAWAMTQHENLIEAIRTR